MTTTVHHAVDALNHAFVEFKSNHCEQLTDISESISKTSKRLDFLETAFKRPMSEALKSHSENKHFGNYIRKGLDQDFLEQKSLTGLQDNSGAFLIPQDVAELIKTKLSDRSVMRRLARVSTISTDALELLVEKGNTGVGWVAETGERAETETPELIKLKVLVHQIYAKPRASQKLLDDAFIDVENWLSGKIVETMASLENAAFIYGNGEGKPKGILSYETCDLGAGTWGKIESISTGSTTTLADPNCLLDAFHALKSKYLSGACWLMSRSAAAAVRKLKDQMGYLWQQSLAADTPNTLLGYPVVFCDDMPALCEDKATPAIVFGNFKDAYQVVDRADLHILRDPFSAKPYVEFYATKRVGGDVINFEALKIIRFAGH